MAVDLVEQARRAEVELKREAAIAARAAERCSPVQMQWLDVAPPFYQRTLAALHEKRGVLTEDERERRVELEARRAFRIAARHIFRLADVDGSRELEISELSRLDAHHAQSLLSLLDEDRSGSVSMEEWLTFTTSVYESRGAEIAYALLTTALRILFERAMVEEADALFTLFDRDNSGMLDYGEVSAMFPQAATPKSQRGRRGGLTDDQAAQFLSLVDLDRSGAIDLEEWRTFILSGWRHDPRMARAFCTYLRAAAADKGYK